MIWRGNPRFQCPRREWRLRAWTSSFPQKAASSSMKVNDAGSIHFSVPADGRPRDGGLGIIDHLIAVVARSRGRMR